MAETKNGSAKISKNEAVRRAVALLGQDAKLPDLQSYIQERFGFEMTLNHIASSRSDIVRKEGRKDDGAPPRPEPVPTVGHKEEVRPAPQPERAPVSKPARQPHGEKITKNEAVRRALVELGWDTKPLVIQGFVKEKFGLDMNTDHISTAKGEAQRKAAQENMPTKKLPASRPAAAPSAVSPALLPKRHGTGGIFLEDILEVKALAARVGPDQLLKLIEAFAK